MNKVSIQEEGIVLKLVEQKKVDFSKHSPDVSKSMGTFYNPAMKIHRDISVLALYSHFKDYHRQISFCDPMVASGIREARYLKLFPELFSKMILGDISDKSLDVCKKTFEENEIDDSICEYFRQKAQQTIYVRTVDCLEIDPYGSPAPFLDAAISSVNHGGLLCVTATDTASLCGVYPKKAKRKYDIDIHKVICFDDLGLRALIAHCIKRAGQFDKFLEVKLAFVHKHFYRIFFKVADSSQEIFQEIKDLKYIEYDNESQEITICNFNEHGRIGPLYLGELKDQEFVEDCLEQINLIEDSDECIKFLEKVRNECEQVGYYDLHKLQSYCGVSEGLKFEVIMDKIREKGYEVSKSHCDRKSIKTTIPHDKLVELIQNI